MAGKKAKAKSHPIVIVDHSRAAGAHPAHEAPSARGYESELDNPTSPGRSIPKPPNPPAGKSVFSPGHSSFERAVHKGRSLYSPEYLPLRRRVAHEQDHKDQEPGRNRVRSGLKKAAALASELRAYEAKRKAS